MAASTARRGARGRREGRSCTVSTNLGLRAGEIRHRCERSFPAVERLARADRARRVKPCRQMPQGGERYEGSLECGLTFPGTARGAVDLAAVEMAEAGQ